jgi:predicted ATPase/class 3 adenylate cyclase/DNA-binding CsgD family transcriptional regulator
MLASQEAACPIEVRMQSLPTGTVTFLFTDIEGSSQRWELDTEGMRAAVAWHDAVMRACIEEHHGHVFKTMGDAFFAVFVDAPAALAAAVAIQRTLGTGAGTSGAAAPPGSRLPAPVRVRIALHTGVAEARDGDYFGPPLNRAARLLAAGHGGQLLVSEATRGLLRGQIADDVRLSDLGEYRLRDLQTPERVYQVTAPGLAADFPPLRTLDSRPHNLVLPLTGLINRDQEVTAVAELLGRDDVRLVTLTGPGGVGKTRVALQVAMLLLPVMADGVFLVSLAPLTDPALVASAIVQALDLRQRGDRPARDQLFECLRGVSMLLVLDNFEHVLSAAPLVTELCANAPNLTVLATSRERLNLRGEHEVAIAPLAAPPARAGVRPPASGAMNQPSDTGLPAPDAGLMMYPAVQLFVERAQAVRGDFELTSENAAAVAEICRRLDGLPLAIELAGARTNVLPPQALVGRLEQRLSVLTGGPRDLPPRQQTMRGAIAWSHDLLNDVEAAVFRRLSVFAGSFTIEAAEAVCNPNREPGSDLLQGITSLVEKTLLAKAPGDDADPRFVMLETVREFAREKLEEAGEVATVRTAHLQFYRRFGRRALTGLVGPEQLTWLARLDVELDNIRAALDWSLTEQRLIPNGQTLAAALTLYWWLGGHLVEGRDWLARLLTADRGQATEARVIALYATAQLGVYSRGYRQIHPILEDCVPLCRAMQVTYILSPALALLSFIHALNGDAAAARAAVDEAVSTIDAIPDAAFQSQVWFWLGRTAFLLGDDEAAQRAWEVGSAALRRRGDRLMIAGFLGRMADLDYRRGRYADARRGCEESIALLQASGESADIAQSLATLGRVALAEGHLDEAARCFRESLERADEAGSRIEVPWALSGAAALARTIGLSLQAVRLFGAAAALGDTAGFQFGAVYPGEHDDERATLRAELGAEAYERAWSAGLELSHEAVIDDVAAVCAAVADRTGGAHEPTPASSARTHGLSSREVEVLQLLAAGMSNPEIADALVISRNTVYRHVSNIFTKLNVGNRVEAATFAHHHALLS